MKFSGNFPDSISSQLCKLNTRKLKTVVNYLLNLESEKLINFSSHYQPEKDKQDKIIKWLLLFTFFSLPLSKAAPLISALLISLLFIFNLLNRNTNRITENKLSVFIILFYITHPFSLIWSNNLEFGLIRSLDYLWILSIAIIISMCETRHLTAYLSSFVIGASLHALFFFLAYTDILFILSATPGDPAISGNRNTYGPITAIAAATLLYLTTFGNWGKTGKVFGLLLVIFLFSTVLMNTSRTGHIVLLILFTIAISHIYLLNKRAHYAIIGLGIFTTLIIASISLSNDLQNRISTTVENVAEYESNRLTSTGIRLSFYESTIELHSNRPFIEQLIGSGVGDYVDDFNAFIDDKKETLPGLREEKNDIQGWKRFRDLHSQLLMNLLKFGYLGLASLIILLAIIYLQIKKNKELPFTGLFIGVFFAFMANWLSQSALETRGLAPTYLLFLGLLFTNSYRQDSINE